MNSLKRIITIAALVAIAALNFAAPAPLKADGNTGDGLTLVQVGQVGGKLSGLTIDRGEAYLGVGPRMVVFDVHNPSHIRQIGQTDLLPDFVRDIVVGNHTFAYVALGESGIRVFDAEPWPGPVELGSIDIPAYGLDVTNSELWVAAGSAGVAVYDITSNPISPTLTATYTLSGIDARAVTIHSGGEYVYVADYNEGLWVLCWDEGVIKEMASFHDFMARSLAIDDDHTLYMVGGTEVVSLDIHNPANPLLLMYYGFRGMPLAVHASGNYGYVVDEIGGLAVINRHGIVGLFETDGIGQPAVFAEDNLVYFGDTAGLWAVDVTNKEEPTFIAHLAIPVEVWDVTTGLPENRAVLAAGTAGVCLASVADPFRPRIEDCYDTGGEVVGVATTIHDPYIYVADWQTGLHILNEDLQALLPLGHLAAEGFGRLAMAERGYYLYVAAGERGLKVVEAFSPETLHIVASYEPDPGAFYYDVSECGENLVCAAAGWDGLEIWRFADLSRLERVAVVGAGEWSAEGIAVDLDRNLVYVAASVAGMYVVNITDIEAPVEIGWLDTPGYAVGVTATRIGGVPYAIVADYYEGVRVVNTTQPRTPVEEGFYNTLGSAWSVAVAGDNLHVADGLGGINILRANRPTTIYLPIVLKH